MYIYIHKLFLKNEIPVSEIINHQTLKSHGGNHIFQMGFPSASASYTSMAPGWLLG